VLHHLTKTARRRILYMICLKTAVMRLGELHEWTCNISDFGPVKIMFFQSNNNANIPRGKSEYKVTTIT